MFSFLISLIQPDIFLFHYCGRYIQSVCFRSCSIRESTQLFHIKNMNSWNHTDKWLIPSCKTEVVKKNPSSNNLKSSRLTSKLYLKLYKWKCSESQDTVALDDLQLLSGFIGHVFLILFRVRSLPIATMLLAKSFNVKWSSAWSLGKTSRGGHLPSMQ